MSSSAVLSDNTRQQADDRQAAILKNIQKLQEMETSLYNKLEAASAANEGTPKQDAIVNKINELSTMRI